jgi:hypothetical protein
MSFFAGDVFQDDHPPQHPPGRGSRFGKPIVLYDVAPAARGLHQVSQGDLTHD